MATAKAWRHEYCAGFRRNRDSLHPARPNINGFIVLPNLIPTAWMVHGFFAPVGAAGTYTKRAIQAHCREKRPHSVGRSATETFRRQPGRAACQAASCGRITSTEGKQP